VQLVVGFIKGWKEDEAEFIHVEGNAIMIEPFISS
jgi:hypothetical protein